MEITYADDTTGASKLEAVSRIWGEIQKENKADRKWVTEDQWKEWERYDKATVEKLSEVIDGFDGVRLSADAHSILDGIVMAVGRVHRVTEAEFIAERDAAALAEKERKLAEEAAAEKNKELKGFKSKLKGLFSSK
jgi:hypothetical protein